MALCACTLAILRGQSNGSFESLAQRANAALETDRVEEAIRLYTQALAVKPDWPEGLWHLGTLEYDRDRFASARDSFKKFVALQPSAGQGWAMLGLCEVKLKSYREAFKAIERGRSLGLGPNREFNQAVKFQAGLLLNKFGYPDAGMKLLEGIAAQVEGGAGVDGKKGLVLTNTAIVDAIGLVALRYPLMPDEVPASKAMLVHQAGLAQSLVAVREYADAEAAFRGFVQTYPNERGVHYMYGVLLLHSDDPQAAEEFKKELELFPDDADSMIQLAFWYLRNAEPQTGLRYAESALKLVPGNFAAYLVLGRLLLGLDRAPDAVTKLEKAAQLAPNSADVHFALASAYSRLGRAEDARREQAEFKRLRSLQEKPAAK